VRTEDFDYHLPSELIAQRPADDRVKSRLLVVDRASGSLEHAVFEELPRFLKSGDCLVLNNTRVIKCRLFGTEESRGGRVELLLLRDMGEGRWEAMAKPGKRAAVGSRISLADGAADAEVVGLTGGGRRIVRIGGRRTAGELMREVGHVPLPPYIKRPDEAEDETRYQTVYAKVDGAVAAPTAGLHFSAELLRSLEAAGVGTACVTLHVGPGTFKPVKAGDPRRHTMDPEWFSLEADQAEKINAARARGRAVCVGTTVARVMETVARRGSEARAGASGAGGRRRWVAWPAEGWTDKFILPPYDFKLVDCLVTNFHLPRTTLLMLVSALAGRELILKAYEEAVARRYRFYSYGDAMLIL
jgi:S-adenosylmethionine:tRNA ribosyltransferase-isomerase